MIPRFRIIAGPNGSGKSTLVKRLAADYAVNFYHMLNADDLFVEASKNGEIKLPVDCDNEDLIAYAKASEYSDSVKALFVNGAIKIVDGFARFNDGAINSYTIALITNFLQNECIKRGISFSQETVFSHHSKIDALKTAKERGFRTYLYFVATEDASLNAERVAVRYAQGGHDVPPEKIAARYVRSIANVPAALKHCSRAFFFDNSTAEMRYVAEYSEGQSLRFVVSDPPAWLSAVLV